MNLRFDYPIINQSGLTCFISTCIFNICNRNPITYKIAETAAWLIKFPINVRAHRKKSLMAPSDVNRIFYNSMGTVQIHHVEASHFELRPLYWVVFPIICTEKKNQAQKIKMQKIACISIWLINFSIRSFITCSTNRLYRDHDRISWSLGDKRCLIYKNIRSIVATWTFENQWKKWIIDFQYFLLHAHYRDSWTSKTTWIK